MFFRRCKLAPFALPAPASALGVLLLAGCSGPQTPAAATAPTPADAAAFIAKAEEELRTVGEEAERTNWVYNTYIITVYDHTEYGDYHADIIGWDHHYHDEQVCQ